MLLSWLTKSLSNTSLHPQPTTLAETTIIFFSPGFLQQLLSLPPCWDSNTSPIPQPALSKMWSLSTAQYMGQMYYIYWWCDWQVQSRETIKGFLGCHPSWARKDEWEWNGKKAGNASAKTKLFQNFPLAVRPLVTHKPRALSSAGFFLNLQINFYWVCPTAIHLFHHVSLGLEFFHPGLNLWLYFSSGRNDNQ